MLSPRFRLLVLAMVWLGFAEAGFAQSGFVEHFDGSSGIDWRVVSGPGTAAVTNGRLKVTPSAQGYIVVRPFDSSGQPLSPLKDISLQATVFISGIAQIALQTRSHYLGAIDAEDAIGVFRDITELTGMGAGSVPFNVRGQDFNLQLDTFGSDLSLSAWPVSDPARSIKLTAIDSTYGAAGDIALWVNAYGGSLAPVEFDDVIATVPEPGALALAGLGAAFLLIAGGRRQSRVLRS